MGNLQSRQKTYRGQKISSSKKKLIIQFIEDLFYKFEVAYHYQYFKIYSSNEKIITAKRLWASTLKNFSIHQLNQASAFIISNNEFIPTLNEFVKAVRKQPYSDSIPSADEAFLEAQKSYSPRKKYNWSHPIVYFAGCKTGWSTLNDSNQYNAINQFRKNYAELLSKLEEGLDLSIDHTETEEFESKKFDSSLFKELRKKYDL